MKEQTSLTESEERVRKHLPLQMFKLESFFRKMKNKVRISDAVDVMMAALMFG